MEVPRVLFIDAYDSFSNNIISLVETELGVRITSVHIDTDVEDLATFIKPFSAVIAGPGPGNPETPEDVGLISQLWSLNEKDLRPVLGICLGFQSLACAFGGRIGKLTAPRHGVSTCITTCETGLFLDMKHLESIQYHSLRASLGHTDDFWHPSHQCPELQPLAWDLSSEENGPILMSIAHTTKPFWGIQFHPESICSSSEAGKVVGNWWNLSQKWNPNVGYTSSVVPVLTQRIPAPYMPVELATAVPSRSLTPVSAPSLSRISSYTGSMDTDIFDDYYYSSVELGTWTVPGLVSCLELDQRETIILDSEKRLMPNLGRFSILAFIEPETIKIQYQAGSAKLSIVKGSCTKQEQVDNASGVFTYLKDFLNERKVVSGPSQIPFWGGLMGYITYEACLETIDIASPPKSHRDDICFAFVERSIVIDHLSRTLYVQSIKNQDKSWVESIITSLRQGPGSVSQKDELPSNIQALAARWPIETKYKGKIAHCQDEIRLGNSYELCLTNQATFTAPKSKKNSWSYYQALRQINPAPFGSYVRMGSATVLSTSPERFMHWTRPQLTVDHTTISTCQFRPIKGTVQKRTANIDGSFRYVSFKEASAILSTPKEQAENLMIVDLIRHDLHGVVGSGNVRVPSLMQVEEYSTVYQLVSVIEGDLKSDPSSFSAASGIDVLAASLPPGSMTGAPKKRSCEILQQLEDESRSLYSGVIGYMCIGGGGDFSVTIRTVFKWDDEDKEDYNGNKETWRIGAGGAITILSELQGEWDEMNGKLASTKRLFEI